MAATGKAARPAHLTVEADAKLTRTPTFRCPTLVPIEPLPLLRSYRFWMGHSDVGSWINFLSASTGEQLKLEAALGSALTAIVRFLPCSGGSRFRHFAHFQVARASMIIRMIAPETINISRNLPEWLPPVLTALLCVLGNLSAKCVRGGENLQNLQTNLLSTTAGDCAKGPRWYEWADITLLSWQMPGQRSVLLRRSLQDGKLAYYVCYAPRGTPLATLVRVAGMRWTVEECFEAVKGEVGLDQYEVRHWHGWYRHMTLAMFAHAFLATLCAHQVQSIEIKKNHRTSTMRQWKARRRQYCLLH